MWTTKIHRSTQLLLKDTINNQKAKVPHQQGCQSKGWFSDNFFRFVISHCFTAPEMIFQMSEDISHSLIDCCGGT